MQPPTQETQIIYVSPTWMLLLGSIESSNRVAAISIILHGSYMDEHSGIHRNSTSLQS